jgi:integration host factor subunit beta
MNKIDLIKKLSEEGNISREEARRIVGWFFDEMAATLAEGGRVEIRGLWSFQVRAYKSYQGRNPKTGAAVDVEPKKLPVFRCGRELRARLNADGASGEV